MAVTVDPKSNKLIIRFRVKGYSKQFYLSTGLKDTKANRAIVESRWELIQREIALGEFDPSLEKYKFGSKAKKVVDKPSVTLLEIWTKYTEYKSYFLAETTIQTHYAKVERYIRKIPHLIDQPGLIRSWLLENTTQQQAYRILKDLELSCNWAVENQLIPNNPFSQLSIIKPKRIQNSEDFTCYSLDERDLIIKSFENHLHSHYADLIKFLFLTGCRPGEAFALTWGDISPDFKKIFINKSRNACGILKGTKNGKKRIFPVTEDSKLHNLLLKTARQGDEELIFRTKTGKKLLSTHLDYVWRGNATPKGFVPGVVRELADQGMVRYLKPYSTRHTFATWAIASGASPAHVANWIGDEIETVLRYYCHPSVVTGEVPDF